VHVPQSFDGYQLLWQLGSGRKGPLYLGHDTVLDRPVVIRLVSLARDADRERFLLEARAVARVQHPSVVTVFRVGELGSRLYIVSEYVRGEPLSRIAKPLPWHQVLELVTSLARGLAEAHRRGVVHGDIRATNVIRGADGEVKLLDFGLVSVSGAPPPAEPSDALCELPPPSAAAAIAARLGISAPVTTSAAEPSAAAGAPELTDGTVPSPRTDVYGLGALAYELITAAAASPDATPGGIEGRFAALVGRCLRRDPSARFATAQELLEALTALLPAASATTLPDGNPYRGLLPFDERYRALFFGRRNEVGSLVERLRSENFVLIAAESGVGKSSLCRAGIVPLVLEGALRDGRTWAQVTLVPGTQPLRSLAAALLTALTALPPLPGAAAVDEAWLRATLRQEPGVFGRELQRRLGSEHGLLVFVDQLEELVTIADALESDLTGEVLAGLCARLPGVRLLATLRSDFLARLAMVPGIGERLTQALYILRPLGPDKLREAVVGPVLAKGVMFESPELVNSLVDSTASADGGLPLLQFALAELWEARSGNLITAAALASIGGVAGALARHADLVVGSLVPEQRALARSILISLVTLEGTRARRTEEDLAGGRPAAREVLNALVRGRLLVAMDTADGPSYEVAHEALIRGWQALRQWLDEYAESRAARQRLEAAAAEWRRLGRAREALWGQRQLREVRVLLDEDLGPREREFLVASQARLRRRRTGLLLTVAAVPALLGGVFWGAQKADQRELQRRIGERLATGTSLLEEARGQNREVDKVQKQALAAFDSQRGEEGEPLWARALAGAQEYDKALGRVSQVFEGVLTLDPRNVQARERLAETLYERALAAERDHRSAQLEDLLQRLSLYDPERIWQQRFVAPGQLSVRTEPPQAQVGLWRYEEGEAQRLRPVEVPAPPRAPLEAMNLAPGSYLLTLQAPEHAPVRYPFVLGRGEQLRLDLWLPPQTAVPPGFVYVPPGRSLFGTAADEASRRSFLTTVPLHPVQTAGYFIARYETTYGDWIAYLNALPPPERAVRAMKVGKGSLAGAVELSELPGGTWMLKLQPASQPLVAKQGEPLVYPTRKLRQRVDWLKLPVGGISFDDAQAYAQWLASTGRVPGARLCDEYEWERAARGADGREFPHGNDLAPEDANFDQTYARNSTDMGPDEVGSHPAARSPFGLDDVAGNVFEWTSSRLAKGELLVRGGGYFFAPLSQRVTNRSVVDRNFRDPNVGVRICATPPPRARDEKGQ
jgi:formylglycine-generating enzyme required for sulfatase activity